MISPIKKILKVSLSNLKPDLLDTVTLKNGGTIRYEYTRAAIVPFVTGNVNRRGAAFRKYVVKKITTNEQTGEVFSSSFTYPDGKYNRTERTFLGFDVVTKTYPNGEIEKVYFRQDLQAPGRINKTEKYVGSSLKFKQTDTWVVQNTSYSTGYTVLLDKRVTEFFGDLIRKE